MTQEVTFLGTSESSPHPSQRRRIQNKQQNSILVVLTDFRWYTNWADMQASSLRDLQFEAKQKLSRVSFLIKPQTGFGGLAQ